MCIEKIRPIIRDESVITDFMYTLVGALKCKNSKVVVHALSALQFYPWQEIITAEELKYMIKGLADHLSQNYIDKLSTIALHMKIK